MHALDAAPVNSVPTFLDVATEQLLALTVVRFQAVAHDPRLIPSFLEGCRGDVLRVLRATLAASDAGGTEGAIRDVFSRGRIAPVPSEGAAAAPDCRPLSAVGAAAVRAAAALKDPAGVMAADGAHLRDTTLARAVREYQATEGCQWDTHPDMTAAEAITRLHHVETDHALLRELSRELLAAYSALERRNADLRTIVERRDAAVVEQRTAYMRELNHVREQLRQTRANGKCALPDATFYSWCGDDVIAQRIEEERARSAQDRELDRLVHANAVEALKNRADRAEADGRQHAAALEQEVANLRWHLDAEKQERCRVEAELFTANVAIHWGGKAEFNGARSEGQRSQSPSNLSPPPHVSRSPRRSVAGDGAGDAVGTADTVEPQVTTTTAAVSNVTVNAAVRCQETESPRRRSIHRRNRGNAAVLAAVPTPAVMKPLQPAPEPQERAHATSSARCRDAAANSSHDPSLTTLPPSHDVTVDPASSTPRSQPARVDLNACRSPTHMTANFGANFDPTVLSTNETTIGPTSPAAVAAAAASRRSAPTRKKKPTAGQAARGGAVLPGASSNAVATAPTDPPPPVDTNLTVRALAEAQAQQVEQRRVMDGMKLHIQELESELRAVKREAAKSAEAQQRKVDTTSALNAAAIDSVSCQTDSINPQVGLPSSAPAGPTINLPPSASDPGTASMSSGIEPAPGISSEVSAESGAQAYPPDSPSTAFSQSDTNLMPMLREAVAAADAAERRLRAMQWKLLVRRATHAACVPAVDARSSVLVADFTRARAAQDHAKCAAAQATAHDAWGAVLLVARFLARDVSAPLRDAEQKSRHKTEFRDVVFRCQEVAGRIAGRVGHKPMWHRVDKCAPEHPRPTPGDGSGAAHASAFDDPATLGGWSAAHPAHLSFVSLGGDAAAAPPDASAMDVATARHFISRLPMRRQRLAPPPAEQKVLLDASGAAAALWQKDRSVLFSHSDRTTSSAAVKTRPASAQGIRALLQRPMSAPLQAQAVYGTSLKDYERISLVQLRRPASATATRIPPPRSSNPRLSH